MELTQRIAEKNVYILGSGFSYPLGIPVISNFIPEGLKLLKGSTNDYSRIIRDVIGIMHRYRSMLNNLVGGNPNLEDYFCAIDANGNEKNDREKLVEFVNVVCTLAYERHDDVCEMVKKDDDRVPQKCRYLPTIAKAHAWSHESSIKKLTPFHERRSLRACVYEAFLSQLFIEAEKAGNNKEARPAVITLNYDTILEKKLANLQSLLNSNWKERGFEFGTNIKDSEFINASNKIHYIKLHGSLDWQSVESDCGDVFVERKDSSDSRMMIMPSWVRGPIDKGLYSKLADDCIWHLKRAGSVFVIGYSMPPTDAYFKFLMAHALDTPETPNVAVYSLLNPDEAAEKTKSMFGPRVNFIEPNEDYGLQAFLRSRTPPPIEDRNNYLQQ